MTKSKVVMSSVNQLERAERSAVSAAKRARMAPKKSRQELLDAVFGNKVQVAPKLTKTKAQVISENSEKYNLISQHICTIYCDSEMYHGRLSKIENNRRELVKNNMTDDVAVNFWNFKTQEYVDIDLRNITRVRSNGCDVQF